MRHCAAREHAVRVGHEAAAREAAVDVFGHAAEVLVDGGVVGVGVGEPVVLVRGQGELVARGAAEDEPGVVHRRLAVRVEGELEQARGQRVVEHREHRGRAPARRGARPEGRRTAWGCRSPPPRARPRRAPRCSARRSANGLRASRLIRSLGRDDADHAAVVVEHRQVVHAVGHHRDAGLRRRGCRRRWCGPART